MIPKALRFRLTAVVCLVVVMAVGWSVACGTDPGAGVGAGNGNPPPTGGACDHPSPGCPCGAVGTTAQCGQVEQRVGTFVTCSMGTTTCNGTAWGACQGDLVTVKNVGGGGVAGGSGLKLAAVGGGSTVCTNNPCDPYCQNFIDTPDSAISSTTSGLCYCEEPPDPATSYSDLNPPKRGNPGTCTGGAVDDCNHDFQCTGADGSGTCTPYGVAGYNAACISSPDFTLGMGCTDGTNWNVVVCNRGLVPASGGNLKVAVQSGDPTGTPGTLPFPSGPVVPAVGTNVGSCTVDLTATPMGPGQCISFPMDVAHCTASSGGALTGFSDGWMLVNPPPSILTGNVPLAECDANNNYTAEKPGHPAAKVCGQQICGTACGAGDGGVPDAGDAGDAGPGCHTYVSGNVWDPGLNATLPNVAVYEPTDGGLIALPTGVTCSSCNSLLSPFVSSTFTDLDGGFSLEVTGTSNVPIVLQTGKWRRQVIVPGPLTACTNNVLTLPSGSAAPGGLSSDQTRLPKTAAEGDIPLTAIITGTREPGECLIGKILGGTTTEMAPAPTLPALPDTGKRIQIYHGTGNDTSPGAPAYGQLYSSLAEMNYYDQIFIPCMGGSLPALDAPRQARFSTWANSGGRMFLDHKSGASTTSNNGGDNGFAPWNTTGTYSPSIGAGVAPSAAPAQGKILGTTNAHNAFKAWMTVNGAYGPGYVDTPDPQLSPLSVAAGSFEWLRGVQNNNWGSTPGGDYTLSYSFDLNGSGVVPTLLGDGGPGPGCGRVIYNSIHVDTARGSTGGTFPGACNFGFGMTPNELMFDYLFFELAACSIGGAPIVPTSPPPPPSPPTLPPVSFTRDFHGICPNGTSVVWQLFNWNAVVPVGTNITFTAQTAADVAGAPGPYGASVPVGVATSSTVGSWDTGLYAGTCDGGTTCACTVDDHLRDLAAYGSPLRSECPGASPAQTSEDWLRVTITLNPLGAISPILNRWEQLFDCAPSQ